MLFIFIAFIANQILQENDFITIMENIDKTRQNILFQINLYLPFLKDESRIFIIGQ